MATKKIKERFKPHEFEKECWAHKHVICGIDEVGRGCLAGPIVTTAIILKPNKKHKYLKDSKSLTKEQRLIAYHWLLKNSTFATGILNHRVIDNINIYQATLHSMKRSLIQLSNKLGLYPHTILVDAMPLQLANLDLNIYYFNFGESQSLSIAAASIIAKVTRDAIMERLDTIFPSYGFINHKGYATKYHRQALLENGKTVIHRTSFLKKII